MVIRKSGFVCAVALSLTCAKTTAATDLRVERADARSAGRPSAHTLSVDVSWKNGRRTVRNFDAVWLFVASAMPNGSWRHVRVAKHGHSVSAVSGVPGDVIPSDEQAGVFLTPAREHKGDVHWRVQLALDSSNDIKGDLHVLGFEMVYVPEGAFTLGDPDPVRS